MRHVAQEAVALLGDLAEAHAQPLELARERAQVGRALLGDGLVEASLADAADRVVDAADGPREEQREEQHQADRDRHQRGGLPEDAPARAFGLGAQRVQLAVGLPARELRELARVARELRELRAARR